MRWFFWLFLLFSSVQSLSYLDNNSSSFTFVDIPDDYYTGEKVYPYKGVGCSITQGDKLYLVSSSYPGRYTYTQQYCTQTKKYVEILEYDLAIKNFTNNLLLGDKTSEYPNAVAGKGSDNIKHCGIHKKYNLLYFVSCNIHNCPSTDNYDSSVVRINLTDFSFHDRTILKNIDVIPR